MTETRPQRPWPGRALPGAISWVIVAAALIGTFLYPRQWVWVCGVFIAYFIVRMAVHLVFYIAGEARCRQWAETDWSAGAAVPGPLGIAADDVWHIVVVPAYREPSEVLLPTLDALSAQRRARERVIVVLAMEEAEPGGIEQGLSLAEQYSDRFRRIVATEHPKGLPGEMAGKAANQTWAARSARREIALLGVDPALVTVTSCDADSRLHPSYLAAVAKAFSASGHPHSMFWQAPLFYDNNIWDVPAPVRLSTWFVHAEHLSELAMPFYEPLPLSTYTLSLQTAEQCGWWDPLVISEDWHEYLNCLFRRGGDVRLEPIFLPTHGDATGGDTWLAAIRNRYDQLVRHAWGAEDVGFLLASLRAYGPLRRGKGLYRLAQVTHDHVLRVATWFLITGGWLLSPHTRPSMALAATPSGTTWVVVPSLNLGAMFPLGAAMLMVMVALDLRRCPPPKGTPVLLIALQLLLLWLGLPVIGLVFGMVPAIYAQTRLMMGRPLAYRSTPRTAREQPA